MRTTIASACLFCTLNVPVHAATWNIGPGQTYTLPSQVSTLVANGDTVDIAAGTYPSDVARWQADDLLLRGVGGMAHLESNGLSWGNKAIWVIQGNNTTVEWIEFSECSVPDENGAGIRQEGLGLKVRHCYYHDNENGILAGELHPCTMVIEHSEFAYNGFGDGYSHNLYIGNIDTLIFRYNYSHHAQVGHELKSRAWVNVIEYNRIGNEADGDASREIDLPNGGQAYLIGNVIQQGPLGQNSNLVGFGLESLGNPGPHELYAINNTLVNERPSGTFFSVANGTALFKAYNNILAGAGFFMASNGTTNLDTLANLRSTDISSVMFGSPATYDYHISTSSPAHNLGFPAGVSNSGYPLVAWYEYVHPTDGTLRCQHALLDAGAFETCTQGAADEVHEWMQLFPNPATVSVLVSMNVSMLFTRVQLCDALGRVLREVPVNATDNIVLDVGDLPAGVHLVRLLGPNVGVERRFMKF